VSQPAFSPPTPARWSHAWQHRERLLRIARRRTFSEQEAEDVVSEVLLRAAVSVPLTDDALARWLTTVTLNVCADLAREHARSGKRALYAMQQVLPEPSPEQLVLDRELAATAVRRLSRLPERQREALLLRSTGFTVAEIATELDVSYKTAESLLSRARAFMRRAVVVTAAILSGMLRRLRRHAKASPVMAAAALTLVIGGGSSPAWTRPTAHGPMRAAQQPLDVQAVTTPSQVGTGLRPMTDKPRRVARTDSHQTPRESAPRRQTMVHPAHVATGPAHITTPPVTYEHGDETFLQTTQRCVQGGVVSLKHIGCPH
jgi:RNA polymerase sigma factor (sigma-70 family)